MQQCWQLAVDLSADVDRKMYRLVPVWMGNAPMSQWDNLQMSVSVAALRERETTKAMQRCRDKFMMCILCAFMNAFVRVSINKEYKNAYT